MIDRLHDCFPVSESRLLWGNDGAGDNDCYNNTRIGRLLRELRVFLGEYRRAFERAGRAIKGAGKTFKEAGRDFEGAGSASERTG